MKIDKMLKRENFYEILENTYSDMPVAEVYGNKKMKLYVYPKLNAIITKNPSVAVKKYIYNEYNVVASPLKKSCVWLYTRCCMVTRGMLSHKKIMLPAKMNRDSLIYPCNRKIRQFDFRENTVITVVKAGFSNKTLSHEIEFRNSNTADFILPITSFGDRWYAENIIDGTPLARVPNNNEYCQAALSLWKDYTSNTEEIIGIKEYSNILKKRIFTLIEDILVEIKKPKNVDVETTLSIIERLCDGVAVADGKITLSLSHGDFHQGNIWLENQTNKIYIIDWETWGKRINSYDECVLYAGLREEGGFCRFCGSGKRISRWR